MTHQALAIKTRPQDFDDFVGQPETVRTLSNALKQQQLHHAYLFSGTRGVGKTTIARILAKCFNCETGITATPCGQCQSCVDITAGKHVDLIEIDAASRTKVEDTRELLDNVPYAPASARFKVYIIDEVHMLTKHSFNALLKTLEEPPRHVKFILATTEAHKIPDTVRSRCLHFALKNIPETTIADRLSAVLKQEAIAIDDNALAPITLAAKGSLRDALSLLDKVIAYCDGTITKAQVEKALGYNQADLAERIMACVAAADLEALLALSHNLQQSQSDYTALLRSLCTLMHSLSVIKLLPANTDMPGIDPKLRPLAAHFDPATLQVHYDICMHAQRDLSLAPTPTIAFEMTLMRMLAFEPTEAPAPVQPSMQAKQQAEANQNIPTKPQASSTTEANDTPNTGHNNLDTRWLALVDALPLSGLCLQLAQNCRCDRWVDQTLHLHIEPKHMPLNSESNRLKIEQSICKQLGRKVQVKITCQTTDSKTLSPAQIKDNAQQLKKQSAIDKISQDPAIQQLKSTFNATLLENSVTLSEDS